MVFSNLEELDALLNRLVFKDYGSNAFLQKLQTELGDRDSLDRLLRVIFENPFESVKILSKHVSILNTYGTFLIKAYSIALLVLGEKRIVLNPVILVNELYRPHYLISLYNPLVLTYLYVNHREHYEHSVWRSLSDQLVIHEFNPVHQTIYLYRDYLFHVSLKYKEFVSNLYGKYGLRDISMFENILQDIPTDRILLSFKNYLRVVSSLLEVLRATLHAYVRSNRIQESNNELSENLLRRIRAIHDNYRYLVSTSINKLVSILNAMLDLEGRVFRDSLIKLFEILTSEREVLKQSRYEILVFTYEVYRFRDSEDKFKGIMYSETTSLSILIDRLISAVNNMIHTKNYVDLFREILSREEEPYSTLRKKLFSIEGVLPEWLEELRSR